MSEWRCDLARWEWWVNAIFKCVNKILFLYIHSWIRHLITFPSFMHFYCIEVMYIGRTAFSISEELQLEQKRTVQPFVCCASLSVHRRAWGSGDAILLVESGGLSANKHQTLLFDAQNQTWQYLTMQAPRSWEKDRTTQLWVEQVSPRCEICRIIGWENDFSVDFADGGRKGTGFF